MIKNRSFIQLDSIKTSLVIDCRNKTPAISYWGKKLSRNTSFQMIELLSTRQEAKCSVVVEVPISLSPSLGEGFTGAPGIEINNSESAWSIAGELVKIEQVSEQKVSFETIDSIRQVRVNHEFDLDFQNSVLSTKTRLENLANTPLMVNWCAAPSIPLTDRLNKIMSFEGRWAKEFQQSSIDLFLGSFLRENRKGKTSHDNFPGLIIHTDRTDEQGGECYGFHLGWSGNHRMRAELLPEGRSYVQMGELLLPGEIELNQNQYYSSPTLYSSYSDQGFSGLSKNFHQFVREQLLSVETRQKPRPIVYNTWEAIYFEHNVETLKSLAKQAAAIGAERFVLDDGWFKGRRGDHAGLGDWTVDSNVYPDGLQPLIEQVSELGMEFGLWFEPEMINHDSDLYRAHPEWVLQIEGSEQLCFRNQLVLDLNRKEVIEYLFKAIDDILNEYKKIAYIKWDMNRDINHPGDYRGKPGVHGQTEAFYQLVARLRKQHPKVEFESCSSGGGRADYGALQHSDRIWTSDSNDALDRLSIQRGFSFFFPAEVMGAHVGPRDCHITGRNINISMRAGVAMFGHMGMEMDPRELTDDEHELLSAAFQLHKKHRQLIHSGELVRINEDGNSINFGIISQDKSHALYAYNSVAETKHTNPPKYRFLGLDLEKSYQLNFVWPKRLKEYSPSILSKIEGEVFSGEALVVYGMQLPIVNPQTTLIFELKQNN